MVQRFQLIVFDWDGTLMDSVARIVSSFRHAMQDIGAQARSDEAIRNIIGLGHHEAMNVLYPNQDDSFYCRLAERYREHFLHLDPTPMRLFPGARELLEVLHCRDRLLAIATSKGRIGLDRVLEEEDCAALIHTSRCADEAPSKPHPRMLEDIMAELGVAPQDTLMVGDTEYDLRMARHAGTASLAVTYGVHDRERLEHCGPLECFDSIDALRGWFRV